MSSSSENETSLGTQAGNILAASTTRGEGGDIRSSVLSTDSESRISGTVLIAVGIRRCPGLNELRLVMFSGITAASESEATLDSPVLATVTVKVRSEVTFEGSTRM